jgi:hypothetical protein
MHDLFHNFFDALRFLPKFRVTKYIYSFISLFVQTRMCIMLCFICIFRPDIKDFSRYILATGLVFPFRVLLSWSGWLLHCSEIAFISLFVVTRGIHNPRYRYLETNHKYLGNMWFVEFIQQRFIWILKNKNLNLTFFSLKDIYFLYEVASKSSQNRQLVWLSDNVIMVIIVL